MSGGQPQQLEDRAEHGGVVVVGVEGHHDPAGSEAADGLTAQQAGVGHQPQRGLGCPVAFGLVEIGDPIGPVAAGHFQHDGGVVVDGAQDGVAFLAAGHGPGGGAGLGVGVAEAAGDVVHHGVDGVFVGNPLGGGLLAELFGGLLAGEGTFHNGGQLGDLGLQLAAALRLGLLGGGLLVAEPSSLYGQRAGGLVDVEQPTGLVNQLAGLLNSDALDVGAELVQQGPQPCQQGGVVAAERTGQLLLDAGTGEADLVGEVLPGRLLRLEQCLPRISGGTLESRSGLGDDGCGLGGGLLGSLPGAVSQVVDELGELQLVLAVPGGGDGMDADGQAVPDERIQVGAVHGVGPDAGPAFTTGPAAGLRDDAGVVEAQVVDADGGRSRVEAGAAVEGTMVSGAVVGHTL